jgi:hypothetical protein
LPGFAFVVASNVNAEVTNNRLLFYLGPKLSDFIIDQQPV